MYWNLSSNCFIWLCVWQMIADLEEEKRRRAQESAQSDDFTFILQTERDKLLKQVWLTCKRQKVCLLLYCVFMYLYVFMFASAKSVLTILIADRWAHQVEEISFSASASLFPLFLACLHSVLFILVAVIKTQQLSRKASVELHCVTQ